MSENTFRVWVGCLGCYNAGKLVGDWFDADVCPADMDEFREEVKVPGICHLEAHEELWCLDTENSPVDGEMSPTQAQEYAAELERIDESDREPYRLYLDHVGEDFSADHLEGFHDSYRGVWGSMADYAQELAEDCGDVDRNNWLSAYIDWDRVAEDMEQDHWTEDADEGGVHVFVSI